jgi:hypothetical protein
MSDALGDGGPSFLDSLGDRGRRRAEPRTSISLAGAGCALGIVGVLALAGDTGFDDDSGDFSQIPGILLSALVIAIGYFVLTAVRRGPVATAGAVAAALGVPAFMFFVTFDENGFPPYNTEGILIVSTAVWLGTYLIGPGKGRPFFLGSGLIGLWFTVLELTENLFEFPLDPFGWFFGTGGSQSFEATGDLIDPTTGEVIDSGGDIVTTTGGFEDVGYDPPDAATVGIISLLFGAGFLLVGRRLDRGGHHGAATPFSFAALPCLVVGIFGLAPDLEASGTGLLLIAIGLVLAYNGATIWRRATSWVGGGTMAIGLALFLGDNAGDSVTTAGMLYIAGGIGMVFVGHLIASAIQEPDELSVTAVQSPPGQVPPPRTAVTAPVAPPAATPDGDPDAPWKPLPPSPGAPGDGERRPSPPPA